MFMDVSKPLKSGGRLRIAVVGTGISGLSAGWLLAQRHDVTVFEADARPGGHSHTVETGPQGDPTPVDTGFIVYNEPTYPNLTALFAHLGVATKASEMSFSVSLDGGKLEYAGNDLAGLFAQKRNVVNLRFWSMLRDLLRFYRNAPARSSVDGRRDAGRLSRSNQLWRGVPAGSSLSDGGGDLVPARRRGRRLSRRLFRRLLPQPRPAPDRRAGRSGAPSKAAPQTYVEALCASFRGPPSARDPVLASAASRMGPSFGRETAMRGVSTKS